MIIDLLAMTPVLASLALATTAPASRDSAADSVSAPEALDARVWTMAHAAYARARRTGVAKREFLVVIDYTQPSAAKRLWVVNMRNGDLVTRTHVAHGSGSGADTPSRFSNRLHSNQSSVGVFVTGESYWGQHGQALRLDGLEPGVNDRARRRNVVFHGSRYVSAALADRAGRVGRSQGCPAVDADEARRLVPILEGGAVIFAWYPERRWLRSSRWIPEALRASLMPPTPAAHRSRPVRRASATRRALG